MARRVALGESLYSLTEELGVSKSVLHRRQRAWRQAIIEESSDAEAIKFWLNEASTVQVARRFLWVSTGEAAWRPHESEDF